MLDGIARRLAGESVVTFNELGLFPGRMGGIEGRKVLTEHGRQDLRSCHL